MTEAELYATLGGTGLTSALISYIGYIIHRSLTKATGDLQKQVTPNGGSSLYDQVKDGKDFAQKALEISVATEARVKQLETKVDALILSRVP